MKIPDRRALGVLLALVLFTALAASGRLRLWTGRPQAGPDSGSNLSSESLRVGSLQLQPCEIGAASAVSTVTAYCTKIPVPENRDQPQGRSIQLRVAVVKSPSAAIDPDLLVFLDGGPGGAATEDYPAYAAAFADMRKRRNLLLIDQRGTGGSNPLSCQTDSAKDAAAELPVDAGNRIDRNHLQRLLRECLTRLGGRADPRFYTTTDAVLDLEAVRQALGAPLLNLVGVSYGTRVAQQYARSYPQAVRSLVLDSAVPNALALGSEHAANLEAALKGRFAACVANVECQKRFGDPYRSLYALRDRLRAKPATATSRDAVSFAMVARRVAASDLVSTARLLTYSPATAALLPLTIDEALKGNYDPLLGQERLAIDEVSERVTDGMGLSVACAEDADLLKARPEDESSLLGNSLIEYQQVACEVWPHGQRPKDFHAPFQGAAPTLVLAGELDPVTPVRYGAQVVSGLPNARLLTLKGQGHAVLGVGCMPRLAGEFIQQLQPQQLDTRCLEALGDIPAFLDYSGAAP